MEKQLGTFFKRLKSCAPIPIKTVVSHLKINPMLRSQINPIKQSRFLSRRHFMHMRYMVPGKEKAESIKRTYISLTLCRLELLIKLSHMA